jgi:hypothetical protein
MQKFINSVKKSGASFMDKLANIDYRVFLAIGALCVLVWYFGRSIIELFKPAATSATENKSLSTKNGEYFVNKQIAPNGHFISGTGVVTLYTIVQARRDAEMLASLLNTSRNSSWYNITLSLWGFGVPARIKSICDKGLPAAYRRYVREVYKDVYTNSRNLQADVSSALTGFAGGSAWNADLTAYFTS